MKFNKKQKRLVISGFVLILLSPLMALIGTPILSDALCASNSDGSGICEGITGTFYAWMPFFFTPLLAGLALILIAFLYKK